jgi:hypothetical protein
MARKLRVEYPGAIYHVMNRGDRREPIFKDELDRRRFIMAAPRTVAAGKCREERDGGRLKPQWAASMSGGIATVCLPPIGGGRAPSRSARV